MTYFHFDGRDYLQTHGIAVGTKMAVAFANVFMTEVETEIINKSKTKPLRWKRYVNDVFSLWDAKREEIDWFILEANRHLPTIKFTVEISEKEINFLDTTIFKGKSFFKNSVLGVCTISNQRRSSNICISLPVTLQASKKVLLKERPWDSSELTL